MSELHHQSIQTGAEAGKKNSLQAEHNQIPTPPLSLLQAMSTSSSLSSARSTEMLRRGENSALQAQLDQATAKIAELKSKMEKFEEEILSTTQTVLDEITQQNEQHRNKLQLTMLGQSSKCAMSLPSLKRKLFQHWKRQTADSKRQKTNSIPN